MIITHAYDLATNLPTLADLQNHRVVFFWTASWTVAGGRSTRYDRPAMGELLQRYVEGGGAVVQCYCNSAPTGAWTQRMGGQSMGEWQGIKVTQPCDRLRSCLLLNDPCFLPSYPRPLRFMAHSFPLLLTLSPHNLTRIPSLTSLT